jgi:hypothetical protein
LAQQELAEPAGLSFHGIQGLERGATHPYRDTALRLITALRLEVDDQARFRAAIVAMRRRGVVRQADTATKLQVGNSQPAPVTRLVGRDEAMRESGASSPRRAS